MQLQWEDLNNQLSEEEDESESSSMTTLSEENNEDDSIYTMSFKKQGLLQKKDTKVSFGDKVSTGRSKASKPLNWG